jgi:uncharacterized membrane protein
MLSKKEPLNDRGQTLPLMALLVLLAVGLAILAAELGAVAVERAQARTAADAAALAAATDRVDPEKAAHLMATSNGATLESFRRDGFEVVIVVRVGRARATAKAQSVASFIP